MPLWSEICLFIVAILMVIAAIIWIEDARDKKDDKNSNNLAVPKNAINYLKSWCKENGYSMDESVSKDGGWELEKETKINVTIIYVYKFPRFTEITTDYEYVVEGRIVHGIVTQSVLDELGRICQELMKDLNERR